MESTQKEFRTIAFIVCYFGKFPQYFNLWLKSCAYNPTVDWILFTDQDPVGSVPNVHYVKTTFQELHKLFAEKLGFSVTLDKPYKICDFRPAYGVIFKEYLKNYDFWGHCDLDMILGDVREFFTGNVLDHHDKILWFGHIALYRNTSENNERYKLPGGPVDYKTVFTSGRHYLFDEEGINRIFRHYHFPLYFEPILIDVIFYRKHYSGFNIKNYQRQVFFWENGKVFQAYQRGGRVDQKEFLSIHFQKRALEPYEFNCDKAEAFFITPKGFFEKKPGVIEDFDFERFNKNPGILYEFLVMQKYFVKLRYSRLVDWMARTFKPRQ